MNILIAEFPYIARLLETLMGVFALTLTTLFTYAVIVIRTIHINGKLLMITHCASLYFVLLASFGKSVPRLFLKEEAITEFETLSGFLHTYGFAVSSLSAFSIAVEQFLSALSPTWSDSLLSRRITHFSMLVSFVCSIPYIYVIHHHDKKILGSILAITTNLVSILILATAWKISAVKYRKEIGCCSLSRRYQLSESFDWTKAVLPALIVGVGTKLASIFAISWRRIYKTGFMGDFVIFGFRMWLIIHAIVLPGIILLCHKRLYRRAAYMVRRITRTRKVDATPAGWKKWSAVQTFSQRTYFELLEDQWK